MRRNEIDIKLMDFKNKTKRLYEIQKPLIFFVVLSVKSFQQNAGSKQKSGIKKTADNSNLEGKCF